MMQLYFSLHLCFGLLLLLVLLPLRPTQAFSTTAVHAGERSLRRRQHQCRIRPSPTSTPSSFTRFLTSTASSLVDKPLLTMDEITECAAAFGIELRLSTLGPFYRIIAKRTEDGEKTEPIGYTEGFVVPPLKLVHLDTMQVRRRYWKQLDSTKKFPFGCGILLGAAAMRHAYDCGCRKAELLAIYDDEKTHRLLKAFYKTAGFIEVKEVTNDVLCIPDLLVWGGVGTRMDMQVEDFLTKWRTIIKSRGV